MATSDVSSSLCGIVGHDWSVREDLAVIYFNCNACGEHYIATIDSRWWHKRMTARGVPAIMSIQELEVPRELLLIRAQHFVVVHQQ